MSISLQSGAPQFPNGTTNGAAWYPLTGGMQDYNYIWHGCMEVTLELSCCKFPPAAELPKFWDDNRMSLLQFIGEAHKGVKGFVKDENAIPVEGAAMKVLTQSLNHCIKSIIIIFFIQVKGRDVGFQTTKEGEFWRILLPGIYTMEVFAEGFRPREVQFAVIEQNPTLLNITLSRDLPVRRRADLSQAQGSASSHLEHGNAHKTSPEQDQEGSEDGSETESTLFGLPNPFSSLQTSVKSFFDKIPVIG